MPDLGQLSEGDHCQMIPWSEATSVELFIIIGQRFYQNQFEPLNFSILNLEPSAWQMGVQPVDPWL